MKKSILELTDNEVIHAPTLEIAEKLCKRFHELGLKWVNEDSYLVINNWKFYESYTYYRPSVGYYGSLSFTLEDHVILTISDISDFDEPAVSQLQPHYDNTHGSLYLIAQQRGWNAYQFDIIKRIDRCLKKGQFKEDLKKSKDLIDLYLQESE